MYNGMSDGNVFTVTNANYEEINNAAPFSYKVTITENTGTVTFTKIANSNYLGCAVSMIAFQVE